MAEVHPVDEHEKRKVIGYQTQENKILERLQKLDDKNKILIKQLCTQKQKTKERLESFNDIIELYKKEKQFIQDENYKLSDQSKQINHKIKDMEENHKQMFEEINKKFEQEKFEGEEEIKKMQVEMDNMTDIQKQKPQIEKNQKELENALELQKKKNQRLNADKTILIKEREKVQATDKLKKEMDFKIQETRQSLLALKDQQVQTTKKLTVLQNNQLTTELEYQNKYTEKLLFQNTKLSEHVNTLKRDVEIHKQVEQDLAKRSSMFQKQIKKLQQQIMSFQDLKKERENDILESEVIPKKNEDVQIERSKDELLNYVEKNFEKNEKLIAKIQNDYAILQNENYFLQDVLESKQHKKQNLANFIFENVEKNDALKSDIEDDQDINQPLLDKLINGQYTNSEQLNEFSLDEKHVLMDHFLKLIKPLLSKQTLHITDTRNISFVEDQSTQDNITFPRLNQNLNMSNSFQANKQGKFKDLPLQISTKIVRGNILKDPRRPQLTKIKSLQQFL